MKTLEERVTTLETQMGHVMGPTVRGVAFDFGRRPTIDYSRGPHISTVEDEPYFSAETAPLDAEGVDLGKGWVHDCQVQGNHVVVFSDQCPHCGELQVCGWKHFCKIKFHDVVVRGEKCAYCHLQGEEYGK